MKVRTFSDRSFGLMLAGAFALVAAQATLRSRPPRLWALCLALAFALVALVRPSGLHPLSLLWARLAALLARITEPLFSAAVYFLLLTPFALLLRLLGRDPLSLRADPSASTYWLQSEAPRRAPEVRPRSQMLELAGALLRRKRYWLLPLLIVWILFGLLFVLTEGSVLAPFIYTLF